MPGPAPNPQARRRNARPDWRALPAAGRSGRAPSWPIGKANRQAVETNQGAAIVFFGMLVTVSVTAGEDEDLRLAAASHAVEGAAGSAKIDLRPCYGAQDTGFAACLPLGVNLRNYAPPSMMEALA